MQNIRNERKFNNSNNVSSERTSKNKQIARLDNRNGQSRQEIRQKRASNTSLRNQSGGLRGRGELNDIDDYNYRWQSCGYCLCI